MTLTFTLDSESFGRQLRQFAAASGKNFKAIIKDEAKLFARACCKMTPPFNINQPVDGSYADQLRIEKSVITRQANSVFKTLKGFGADQKLSRQVLHLVRVGKNEDAKKLLSERGIHVDGVIDGLTEDFYNSLRNKQGRLTKKCPKYLVCKVASIGKVVREKFSHIGKGKGGWVKALEALGDSVPGWIKRHDAHGHFKVVEETPMGMTFEIGNFVPFIQQKGRDLKIMQEALKFREERVKLRLQRAIEHM